MSRRILTGLTCVLLLSSLPVPGAMAQEAVPDPEWTEVSSLLSSIQDAYTAPPALTSMVTTGYTSGLLLGNGDVAVTSDARDQAQTFYLAKSDFQDAAAGQLPLGKIGIRGAGGTTAVPSVKDELECSAACAIDGDPETRWVSSTTASAGAPQWVTVDLGEPTSVDRWVVRHNGYTGRADNFQKLNTRDFALQRSDDGVSWSDVDTVTGNTAELTDRKVPAFTARYVRLNITGAVRDPADPNQKAYLRDFQLYDGAVNLTTGTGAADPNYKQQQDILNAEVRGTQTMAGQVVHSRTWEADGENLLVTELSTDAGTPRIPIQVDLTVSAGTTGVAGDGQVWITHTTGADGVSGWVSKAAASTKVLGASATASTPSATDARLAFDLAPGRPVRIVTSLHGKGSYANRPLADFTAAATARVADLDDDGVDAAQAAHRDWWKKFWLKSYVDTGDATLNKYYYGALHALGASSREGFAPAGAYSPWRTTDGQANKSYLNYNAEAPYFGAYSANRAELAKAYYPLIQAEMPYSRNKTHAAGYQGLTFSRSFGPYNMTRPAPAETPVAATKKPGSLPSDQQTNGFYAAIPFLWDYEYTGNLDFYRTVTYPFLKELGAFWADFVVKDAATGKYIVQHSGVNEGGDDTNSVYDLGYIRRNLSALLEGSRKLGVDANLRAGWQDVLDNLTPYPEATMDGLDVILLASEIHNSIKGNALLNKNDQPINLEGVVFPSDNLAIGGDPAMLQKVRNTLTWVDPFKPGTRGSSINGFPKTFPIAARAGWPAEDLIGKFKTVITALWRPNLTVRQSGGGTETSGAIETIDSMFLQTYEGVTRVFPNWPAARDAHFTRLRAKGAFTVSSRMLGGQVGFVDVTSDAGNTFTLAAPWGTSPVDVRDSSGKFVAHSSTGGTLSFPTTAGVTYHLTPQPPASVIAAGITAIPAPDGDSLHLALPPVREGFTVAFKSSGDTSVVLNDGTVVPRATGAVARLVLTVTRTADGSTAETAPITVALPPSSAGAVASTLKSITVEDCRQWVVLPAVPPGFQVRITSSDDPAVIGLNGKIRQRHDDTVVTLVLTVTRRADHSQAVTAPIQVTVPGKKDQP